MWNDILKVTPEHCDAYLVYVHEINDLGLSSYIDIAVWNDRTNAFQKAHRISHWMPLPSKPTDEEMDIHTEEDKRRLRQYIANDF